jgi:hypothetical protein
VEHSAVNREGEMSGGHFTGSMPVGTGVLCCTGGGSSPLRGANFIYKMIGTSHNLDNLDYGFFLLLEG